MRRHWRILIGLVLATSLGVGSGCLPRERDISGEKRPESSANPIREAVAGKQSSTPSASLDEPPERLPRNRPASGNLDPRISEPFIDNFDRAELGPWWRATSPVWKLRDGKLCGQSARNHPVWLARRLPVNARIEFDATSFSPNGDIKAEFWGDGSSAASSTSYDDATSYLTIFGGWRNKFHVLARLDEHAKDRVELAVDATSEDVRARPVQAKQTYHFKVERTDGSRIRWFVDDIEIHVLKDADPLAGKGHEHFGFNDWEVRVCFDNLKVIPL